MYIVIAIIMFGILIAVHELGHFITAKLCGVRVNEFALGMGPAILKKQRGETLYSLRILPIGGFCAMEGEDGESDDPRSFINQSGIKRLMILFAGVFMNFVLGLILIVIMYSGAEAFVSPTVADFMPGCPYQGENAIMIGDKFYSIDGDRVYLPSDVGDLLANGDGRHDIVLLRGGEKVELNDFELKLREYEGAEGLKYGFYFGYVEADFGTYAEYTWNTALEFLRWIKFGLRDLFSGAVGVNEMAGVVGIVDMMNDIGQQAETPRIAAENLLYISAFIAINLAVMNLLPLPALDGGRIFLLIVTAVIEKITHKKLDPKYEGWINAVGLGLLMLLMVFIMFNDIMRIIRG